ncbi:MAG: ribosome maturation factor RimP [Myxococcota bacterium]|jgi:ribosome maturation factor RimP|nr:ribosome maturation factor RimP [Myxococcota bacterium]
MALPATIEALLIPVLDRHGCDLVLGTLRREEPGLVLRLLIERRGSDPDTGSGVDLGLCRSISVDVSALLDAQDTIAERYTLEVSSPGIERPLAKPEDFVRFVGRLILVKTRQAIEKRKRFEGVLRGLVSEEIVLETEGEQQRIPLSLVSQANLVFRPQTGRSAGPTRRR